MLSIKTAQLAIDMAQELDSRGLVVIPANDSMLNQLNASASVSAAHNEFGNGEYNPSASELAALTQGGENGESVHTTHIDEMARNVGDSLLAHINFARTNVKAIIAETSQSLTGYISSLPSENEYTIKVHVVDLPAPLKEPALVEALAAYAGQSPVTVNEYVPLPPGEEENYLEYLKTGDPGVDSAIAVWVNTAGEAAIKAVFLSLFSDKGHPTQTGARLSQLLSGTECFDNALAAYLFSSRLLATPPKGIQMNLSEFSRIAGLIRDQAALRCTNLLSNYNLSSRNGTLVRYWTPTQVAVNASVYEKWIESGNTDSILFGAQLSPNAGRTVRELDERRDEFVSRWQRECTYVTSTERNLRLARLTHALRERLSAAVISNQKLAFEHLVGAEALANPSDIYKLNEFVEFNKKLDVMLQLVREADFQNVWSLVTRVVCTTLFPYTDALQILTGIDEAAAENPELTPQEALLFSLIDLAADYEFGQFEIKQ